MYSRFVSQSLFRIQRHQQFLVARNAQAQSRFLTSPPPKSSSESSTSGSSSSSKPQSPDAQTQPEVSQPEASPSPASLSLDFAPSSGEGEQSAERQRTGAKSSKDSLSSIERKRRNATRTMLAMMGLGALASAVYMGREWEEGEMKQLKLNPENAPNTRIGRTKARFMSLFSFFSEPTWDELLPPPVPQYQKPYTLLLSIDDLLVTSTWDRVNGWRTAKRPGVDYFLAYLSQFYEIVIFTSQHHYTALPIIEKLDPYNFFITYKLFRESTKSVNGTIKKDLTYLNRDLSKVIIIDTDPEHVSLQPENSIVLPKWKGDPRDKGLIALIPFLESIGIYKPPDVRPILSAYHGKDIAVEYAKKEAEAKERFLEEWRKSGKGKSSGGISFSSLFGGSSGPQPREPLTYLEQKRREAQIHYLEEQKYIAENKAQFDKLIEEDRKAQEAQMSGNMWSVLQMVAGGQPPQPPSDSQAGQSSDQSAVGAGTAQGQTSAAGTSKSS